MPAILFTADKFIRLVSGTDNGTTFSYSVDEDVNFYGAVVDANDDDNLDTGTDFYYDTDYTYSGYTVEINGRDYAIFRDPIVLGMHYIPYDSTLDNLGDHFSSIPSSTTTKNENGVAQNFCFLTGTKIAGPSGETAIEDLKIGDQILTAEGNTIPVKWIGRQSVNAGAVNLALPQHRLPVIVAKGALGNHSDLLLSADHGLLLDGHIVNAAALVNGDNIRFATEAETGATFTYWHIETDGHENILANGIAAETFIDAAGRAAFDNHDQYLDLHGAERITPEQRLPRITSARMLPQSILAILDADARREITVDAA